VEDEQPSKWGWLFESIGMAVVALPLVALGHWLLVWGGVVMAAILIPLLPFLTVIGWWFERRERRARRSQ
jgi:hypothetical protein